MSTINVNTISPQSGSDLSVTSTKFTGSLLSTASFGRIQATTLAGNSPIEIDGEITGTISGSITSTASFGTYIGDGGQLSGIETLQRTGSDEVSGSARVFGPTSLTGSLIVSGSNIEYTNTLSGSLTSTASFGNVNVGGGESSKVTLKDNIISGSMNSTGSLGALNVGLKGISGGIGKKMFMVNLPSGELAHFGGLSSTSGYTGISLGYRAGGLSHIKTAIVQKQTGDSHARGELHFLNNNAGWAQGATIDADTKMIIQPGGNVIIPSGSVLVSAESASISGSITSTGSFGKINIVDSIGKLSRITSSFALDVGPGEATITGRSNSTLKLEWKNQSNNTVYSDHTMKATGHKLGLYYGGSYNILDLQESNISRHAWSTTNYVASHDAFEYSSSRTSIHKLGSISASGDITMDGSGSLTGVTNIVATGDIRADGDVIAQNLIVSSSITHMTTSFSSGSTKFGDSNDDTHTFTGSLIQSGGMNVFASASFFGHDNTSAGWASVNSETGMLNVSMSKDGADTSHGIVIRHHYNETGTAYPLLIQNVGGTNKAYIDYTGTFVGNKVSFNTSAFQGSIDGSSGNNSNMAFVANSRGFTFKSEGKTLLDMTGVGGVSTLDIQSNTTIKDDLLVTGSISIASGSITGSISSTGSFGALVVEDQIEVLETAESTALKYANGLLQVGLNNSTLAYGLHVKNPYSQNQIVIFESADSSVSVIFKDSDNQANINYVGSTNKWKFGTDMFHISDTSISASLASTASFGKLLGDGSDLTGVTAGIFFQTGSMYATTNNLQVTGSVDVTGSFSATAKSFVIPHPAKDQGFLQHGSLEGPEHGVYVRGHLKDNDTITLPDYWDPLVDELTISVQLTPKGNWQQLFVKEVSNTQVVVQNQMSGYPIDCYYVVQGERKDIPKIELEL